MRRRALTGRPLLAATAGAAIAVGCSGNHYRQPVGNLMAPPDDPPQPIVAAKLCVDTVPEDAAVLVNDAPLEERCTEISGELGSAVRVVVSAPPYETQERVVQLMPDLEPITVELVLLSPETLEPVGNLMAPPRR